MSSPTFSLTGSPREKINDSELYHTFWRRFWAGALDGLVLLPVTIPDAYLSRPERSTLVLICWAIFYTVVLLGYSIVLHARFGQTIGKMVMGVKVWDVSETRLPSLKQAFLRDIGTVASSLAALIFFIYLVLSHQYVDASAESRHLPGKIIEWTTGLWFWLEVISMLTNRKRRALHDLIAGTVVCLD